MTIPFKTQRHQQKQINYGNRVKSVMCLSKRDPKARHSEAGR